VQGELFGLHKRGRFTSMTSLPSMAATVENGNPGVFILKNKKIDLVLLKGMII